MQKNGSISKFNIYSVQKTQKHLFNHKISSLMKISRKE